MIATFLPVKFLRQPLAGDLALCGVTPHTRERSSTFLVGIVGEHSDSSKPALSGLCSCARTLRGRDRRARAEVPITAATLRRLPYSRAVTAAWDRSIVLDHELDLLAHDPPLALMSSTAICAPRFIFAERGF